MRTFFLTTGRAATLPLAVLATFSMAACGGGGESPRQAMTLSQVSLTCQQQPGETCTKMQANVMLSADVTDQRPLWEEKPAGASKIFDKVKPVKQADGSWVMVFSVKPGLPEGTYSGTVDFSVFVSPIPGTPNYQPRTASYSVTVASMKGKLSALQAERFASLAGRWRLAGQQWQRGAYGAGARDPGRGQIYAPLDLARWRRHPVHPGAAVGADTARAGHGQHQSFAARRLVAIGRAAPMPTASSCAATVKSSPTIPGSSAATGPSTTRGTICRCW